jgi:hypothetical protein
MASIEDLEEIVAKEEERLAAFQHRILVCTASGCPPFFARQQKIVLENAGVIDPDSFKGYVAVGGYRPWCRRSPR